jgi:two-component system chemotaxis response regulator CheV
VYLVLIVFKNYALSGEDDIVDNIFTVIEDVMADIFGSVNDRMVLVGQNRLELLIFKLATDQIFGINVFKVREVLKCPPLSILPKQNAFVGGIAHIRGQTMSIIDLSKAI